MHAARFHHLQAMLFAASLALARAEPTTTDHVEKGAYTLHDDENKSEQQRRQTHYWQTTILELKDGRFRYWSRSDAKMPGEPAYPQIGKYEAKDGVVTIKVKTGSWPALVPGDRPNDVYRTLEWKFMTYQDRVILWPLSLLGPPKDGRPPHNVLFRTKRKPEEIWKGG
jgi:hypothetical protein